MERITNNMLAHNSLFNIQQNLNRMVSLNEQLSSGKVLNRPSDDPAKAVDSIRFRNDLRATNQYSRNADDGNGWLTTVDRSLQTSVDMIRRAKGLALEGASSGKMAEAAREALASELEGISKALLSQANTTYLGRTVFAGTSDAGVAFKEAGGDFSHTGSLGEVSRRIAQNTLVRVDADGASIFGVDDAAAGTSSIFKEINDLAAAIRAGDKDKIDAGMGKLDVRHDNMLKELSTIGTRHKQVIDAGESLLNDVQLLKKQISDVEDADYPAAITELMLQEVSYKAALGATQRTLQPSLLDYLR